MILADPVGPGRDAARRAAQQELSRHDYDAARPSLLVRLIGRAVRAVLSAFDAASARVPGGRAGLVLLLVLLVGMVVLLLVRLRPTGSGVRRETVFGTGSTVSSGEHRDRAQACLTAGDVPGAVRERMRAVVRLLEERGVLDPRPGRTAVEVARDAGARVPGLAGPVREAASLFDEVVYGGRRADRAAYEQMVALDEAITAAPAVLV